MKVENGKLRRIFKPKMNIALKEASETKYWLQLLFETDFLKENEYNSIINDCIEIEKLLTKIVKNSKQK